jgi:hypothetical protein
MDPKPIMPTLVPTLNKRPRGRRRKRHLRPRSPVGLPKAGRPKRKKRQRAKARARERPRRLRSRLWPQMTRSWLLSPRFRVSWAHVGLGSTFALTCCFCAAAPASSPTKQKGLAAPEAFGSQSLATGRATRQTAEERADNWNMHYFSAGRPIWVHLRAEGKGGFWWPGEVSSATRASLVLSLSS